MPDSNWVENDSLGPIEDISEVPLFSVTISDIHLHKAIFNLLTSLKPLVKLHLCCNYDGYVDGTCHRHQIASGKTKL